MVCVLSFNAISTFPKAPSQRQSRSLTPANKSLRSFPRLMMLNKSHLYIRPVAFSAQLRIHHNSPTHFNLDGIHPRSLLRGWMPSAVIGAKPLSVRPRSLLRRGFILYILRRTLWQPHAGPTRDGPLGRLLLPLRSVFGKIQPVSEPFPSLLFTRDFLSNQTITSLLSSDLSDECTEMWIHPFPASRYPHPPRLDTPYLPG